MCRQPVTEADPPEIEFEGGWYDVHSKCKKYWDKYQPFVKYEVPKEEKEETIEVRMYDPVPLWEWEHLQDLAFKILQNNPDRVAKAMSKMVENVEDTLMGQAVGEGNQKLYRKKVRTLMNSMVSNLHISTPRMQGKTQLYKEFQKFFDTSTVHGYSSDLLVVDDIIPSEKKLNPRSKKKIRKSIFDKAKGNEPNEFIRKRRNKQRKMSKLRYT
jgi:hypothetical protein